MKLKLFATLSAVALAAPALAQDAAKGEREYNKCKSCHMIEADDGTTIVRGGKTGPNLYGIVGRQVASVEGFRYGDSILEVGETGLVWTEEELVAYVTDPKAWLADKTGDAGARSKMTFKLRGGQEDVAGYLASLTE